MASELPAPIWANLQGPYGTTSWGESRPDKVFAHTFQWQPPCQIGCRMGGTLTFTYRNNLQATSNTAPDAGNDKYYLYNGGTQAIVIEIDSLTGNWEVVNGYATLRYRQTLRKLLDRLAQWQVTVYCTDHWEAYASELEEHPEAHHVETKTETRNIERNNSDHRHWFARFRRQSKVVSKSKEMVELTMALFAKFRVNGTINSMRDSMLALLT